MQCRPPRKIKRYLTDPEEVGQDNRYKYSNLTMQQLKLQVNSIDTLNDISVPPLACQPLNPQKNNTFLPLHSKFHLRRNPLKKLPDLNTQTHSHNGWEPPKPLKMAQPFKRSNPLFVVNSLFDILKEDLNSGQNHQDKLKKNAKQKQSHQNEFSQFDAKSVKVQRGPRLVDSELSRLTQQSKFSHRKIYSEEKSRPKATPQVELLTFYKPRVTSSEQSNQFLS